MTSNSPVPAFVRSGHNYENDLVRMDPGTYNLQPPERDMCEELDALKRGAVLVSREARKIRRSRDVSFHEDAELNGEKYKSINAVIKHLLVGHDGKPCPAGDRPIVGQAHVRG